MSSLQIFGLLVFVYFSGFFSHWFLTRIEDKNDDSEFNEYGLPVSKEVYPMPKVKKPRLDTSDLIKELSIIARNCVDDNCNTESKDSWENYREAKKIVEKAKQAKRNG